MFKDDDDSFERFLEIGRRNFKGLDDVDNFDDFAFKRMALQQLFRKNVNDKVKDVKNVFFLLEF